MIDYLKAMGEKQLETFASDRLVKVSILQKITLNKIEIWNHTDTGQLKCNVEFSPFKFAVKKINSACKHIETIKNCLNMKQTISLKACAKMVKIHLIISWLKT